MDYIFQTAQDIMYNDFFKQPHGHDKKFENIDSMNSHVNQTTNSDEKDEIETTRKKNVR